MIRFPKYLFAVCALLLFAVLPGCTREQPWKLHDVSGVVAPLEFSLRGGNGATLTEKDFRGRIVMLFFGYTSCPDVCPATLAKLTGAVRQLGKAGDDVRILFVSVDPARDTPEHLKSYAAFFDPRVVGLTAADAVLRALTKRYRVTYSRGKADADGNYEVSHSSGVFIFDGKGRARLLASGDEIAAAISADLERLVAEDG